MQSFGACLSLLIYGSTMQLRKNLGIMQTTVQEV